MRVLLKILVLLSPISASKDFGQTDVVFVLGNLSQQDTLLSGWKIYEGDDPRYANADLNDGAWRPVDPAEDVTGFK